VAEKKDEQLQNEFAGIRLFGFLHAAKRHSAIKAERILVDHNSFYVPEDS
jgi:hypothetical protein